MGKGEKGEGHGHRCRGLSSHRYVGYAQTCQTFLLDRLRCGSADGPMYVARTMSVCLFCMQSLIYSRTALKNVP